MATPRARAIPGTPRAEATGLPVTSGSGFFNTAAFTVPATGTFGDAGRDTIPGIAQFTLTASFFRSFRIDDKRRIEFRIDSTNPDQSRQYHGDQYDGEFHTIRIADGRRRHAIDDRYSEAEILMKRLLLDPRVLFRCLPA